MAHAVELLTWFVIVALFLWVIAYVTFLFFVRLRNKESLPRSFFRWLLDLFDLIPG